MEKEVELNNISKPKVRDSNFELLRIFAIVAIVIHHVCLHGAHYDDFVGTGFTFQKFILQYLIIGGKLGVNLFLMITGYFMVKSKVSIKKLLKLIGQVYFYCGISALIIGLALYFKKISFSGLETSKGILIVEYTIPLLFSTFGFFSKYVIVYLLSTFINKMMNNLSKKEIIVINIIGFITLSVLQTITIKKFLFESSDMLYFIYLYIVGASIRLLDLKLKKRYSILGITIVLLIMGITFVVFDFLKSGLEVYFLNQTSFLQLGLSIFLFLFFKELHLGHISWINYVASTSFGIFLIHEGPLSKRNVIWEALLNGKKFFGRPELYLYILVTIVIILVLGIAVDSLRKLFVYIYHSIYNKLLIKRQA